MIYTEYMNIGKRPAWEASVILTKRYHACGVTSNEICITPEVCYTQQQQQVALFA